MSEPSPRVSLGWFLAIGVAVALVAGFFVSPWASSNPDGLERVAIDEQFAEAADAHLLETGPLADYGVGGVENPRLSTGLAGVIGIAITFGVAAGTVVIARRMARRREATPLRA